jgi:hypothetical protein
MLLVLILILILLAMVDIAFIINMSVMHLSCKILGWIVCAIITIFVIKSLYYIILFILL